MVSAELDRVKIAGMSYWVSAGARPPAPAAGPTAHLLQGYDELVSGYGPTKSAVDLSGRAAAAAERGWPCNALLVIDGQLAGHWKRTITAAAVAIQVVTYDELSAAHADAVRRAAQAHADFLDRSLRLELGLLATPPETR